MPKKPCCVIGCPTSHTGSEALYLFPKKSTQRYQRWMMLFPYSFMLRVADNFICRRHFTSDSFDDKQRLKLSADPTVHIDISYARDQILETFLTKIVYEWSIRCDSTEPDVIIKKSLEAKQLLGLIKFNPDQSWVAGFLRLRKLNDDNKVRYGTEKNEQLINIIKELRRLVPSNFTLPVDSMAAVDEDVMAIKMEPEIEDILEKDALQAPNTYEEALTMLKPLEVYLSQANNKNAMTRLREIESCIKEVIAQEGN